jgi:hypothetical protein
MSDIVVRTTRRLADLWNDGWETSDSGHLVSYDNVVPHHLIQFLGQARWVEDLGHGRWKDSETGYVWPAEVLVGEQGYTGGAVCECGAKHTSAPAVEHSRWCPKYRRQ